MYHYYTIRVKKTWPGVGTSVPLSSNILVHENSPGRKASAVQMYMLLQAVQLVKSQRECSSISAKATVHAVGPQITDVDRTTYWIHCVNM